MLDFKQQLSAFKTFSISRFTLKIVRWIPI